MWLITCTSSQVQSRHSYIEWCGQYIHLCAPMYAHHVHTYIICIYILTFWLGLYTWSILFICVNLTVLIDMQLLMHLNCCWAEYEYLYTMIMYVCVGIVAFVHIIKISMHESAHVVYFITNTSMHISVYRPSSRLLLAL